jgi:hypothetical protein
MEEDHVKAPVDDLHAALLMDRRQIVSHEQDFTVDQIQKQSETVQMATIIQTHNEKLDEIVPINLTDDVQLHVASMNTLNFYDKNSNMIPEDKITDAMRAVAVIHGHDAQLIDVDVPGVLDRYHDGLGDVYMLGKNMGYSSEELTDQMLKFIENSKNAEKVDTVDEFKAIDFGDEFDEGATVTKSGGMTEEKFNESLRRMDEVLGGNSTSRGRSI